MFGNDISQRVVQRGWRVRHHWRWSDTGLELNDHHRTYRTVPKRGIERGLFWLSVVVATTTAVSDAEGKA